jgi:hypothetical protein
MTPARGKLGPYARHGWKADIADAVHLSEEMNACRSTSGCCVTLIKPPGRSSDAIRAITMPNDVARMNVALVLFDPVIPA